MKIAPADLAALVNRYRKILGFDDAWKFQLRISESPDDTDAECPDAQGYTQTLDGYSSAQITINAWRVEDEQDLERLVAHEMVHAALWEVSSIVRDSFSGRLASTGTAIVEQTVSLVARALERAAAPAKKPRKASK